MSKRKIWVWKDHYNEKSIHQTKPRLKVNQAAKTTTFYPLLLTKLNKESKQQANYA